MHTLVIDVPIYMGTDLKNIDISVGTALYTIGPQDQTWRAGYIIADKGHLLNPPSKCQTILSLEIPTCLYRLPKSWQMLSLEYL